MELSREETVADLAGADALGQTLAGELMREVTARGGVILPPEDLQADA